MTIQKSYVRLKCNPTGQNEKYNVWAGLNYVCALRVSNKFNMQLRLRRAYGRRRKHMTEYRKIHLTIQLICKWLYVINTNLPMYRNINFTSKP